MAKKDMDATVRKIHQQVAKARRNARRYAVENHGVAALVDVDLTFTALGDSSCRLNWEATILGYDATRRTRTLWAHAVATTPSEALRRATLALTPAENWIDVRYDTLPADAECKLTDEEE